jgi:hypothetical protein
MLANYSLWQRSGQIGKDRAAASFVEPLSACINFTKKNQSSGEELE